MAKSLNDRFKFYHKKATYSEEKPKGCPLPWGWFIRQRQFSSGANRNRKPRQVSLLNVNKSWFQA